MVALLVWLLPPETQAKEQSFVFNRNEVPSENSIDRLHSQMLIPIQIDEHYVDKYQMVYIKTTNGWHGYKNGDYGGWCVDFAKKVTGVSGTWGYGGRNLPLTKTPQVGAVLVEPGHVSIVIAIEGNTLVLAESNYHRNKRISVGRRIEISNPLIRGYFIPEV